MTREKSKAQVEQKAIDKQEIENYKKNNPEFKKQMDEVHVCVCVCVCLCLCLSLSLSVRAIYVHTHTHTQVHLKWMEAHGHLPKTKAEVKAYAELVNKVSI